MVAFVSIGALPVLCSIALSESEDGTPNAQRADTEKSQWELTVLEAPSHEQAAALGLTVLIQLQSDNDNHQAYAKFLGFNSVQDVQKAALGDPLRAYGVHLNRLIAFDSSADPDKLLFDTRTIVYPLYTIANGQKQVHSSLTVVSEDGKTWHRARTGSSKFIAKIERYRTSASNFLVIVPALGQRFLADRSNDKFMLIPLNSRLGFTEGKPVQARDLFKALALETTKLSPQPLGGTPLKPGSTTP